MTDGSTGELARYLDEQIPPQTAGPAIQALMAEPPHVLLKAIEEWAGTESRTKQIPLASLLLYALSKIYVLGELYLLDPGAVADFLDPATTHALRLCPEETREALRAGLTDMRASHATEFARPRPPSVSSADDEEAREREQASRKFSLILDRLGKKTPSTGAATEAESRAAAQVVTMAAASATTSRELEQFLEQIRKATGEKEKNVFAVLGGGLASWDLPLPPPGEARKLPAQVAAMEKIVDLAETPTAALQRLRELVTAAVAKFNQGSLAASMWMFDVAQSGIDGRKLDPAVVERIRGEGAAALDLIQLRKYAENRTKHAALKIALDFFPTMRLEGLFRQLRGEPRAEKRRSLLGLIETHGQAARLLALSELEAELKREDFDTWYLRNTVYVQHRVARERDDEPAFVDRQLATLEKTSALGQNVYVVREAIAGLGHIRTDASVKLLTTRLAELEVALLRNDASKYPLPELQMLVDRVVGAIAKIGTPAALLTVARHGMKANPLLGDTRSRLGTLAHHDLSFHEDTVALLVKALREELPGRLLGRLLPKKQEGTVRLIEALSGTRSEEVDETFREIAERFPAAEIGLAATEAIRKRTGAGAASRETAATFSGELEFFGVPAVLQSLVDSNATGLLTLGTKSGQVAGKVVLAEGKFLDAQRGHLRGIDAFYEILEHPGPGSFAFVPYPPEKVKGSNPPQSVLQLLFEGVRRQDELQLMIALVPDDAVLAPTEVKPTPHEDEKDPGFFREVWLRATSGRSVSAWSAEIAADAYRIRQLLAHWVETGALVAR